MPDGRQSPIRLRVVPLTEARWSDFEGLFGPRGACGGCWCMTPRMTRSEYEKHKGAGNRRAMRQLVRSGRVPGVLGYIGTEPVAWCSIEPREAFSALARSRICKPVDDRSVWSVVCLFVAKPYRGRGVSVSLIRGAVDYARSAGARCIEAYPIEPVKRPMPDVFAYTGLASAYRSAGFKEIVRRSPTRPIMRREVRPRRR